MTESEFLKEYSEYKRSFEEYADRVFGRVDAADRLVSAMKYSLFAGGKRVRPVLMLKTAEIFGIAERDILPFALALECIHTSSLIHDDLPALDNDTLRRGVATNHVVYGEAVAILAGDALMNFAYEHALASCDGINKVRALKILADMTGSGGMLGGQVLDMQYESSDGNEEVLLDIYEKKTSKLLAAAFIIPETIAGKSDDALYDFSLKFGRLFQFVDDLADACSSADKMGKTVGKDEAENKLTAVKIYGVDGVKREISRLLANCENFLKSFDKSGFLQCFMKWITGVYEN